MGIGFLELLVCVGVMGLAALALVALIVRSAARPAPHATPARPAEAVPVPPRPAPAADPSAGGVYFVTANVWLIAGLVLLLGGTTLFGYGRVHAVVYWAAVWAAFGAAAVCARRWRAAASPPSVDGPPPAARDVALVGLVGLILFAGVVSPGLLRAVESGWVGVDRAIALTGLGLGWLGGFYALLGVARGRSVELVGFSGAAGLLGFACLVFAFAVGAPGGSPPVFLVALAALGLVGAVVLSFVGATRSRPAAPAPAATPAGVGRAFVGCGIVAAVLAGLVVFGYAVPGWLGAHPDAVGRATNVAPVVVFALIVVMLLALVGSLLAHPRPAPPTPTPPPITPAAETAPARDCPTCGQPVPAGAPQGLCPRCLLKGVMPSASQPSPTLAFVEAFVAPPVEDVAKLFPQLEVKELVGQGGMGAVYLARQTALDRAVALKLIRPREADPTFAERFAREARALAKLTHPNVVTVHESGTAGGLPYLVMEYVDGVTLRDAMREKKLEPAAALAVVRQLCDALEYAHAQGVVHRDVKPENILLTRDGRVKIADFGLAKVADPTAMSLTGTQQAMGTPHYMAPEQWEKPAAVDHRADLYALGVVLYELLTGELPLGRFDPPSQKVRLDVRLDEIVLRALAKEPDRRYQHASDVRTDLDRVGTPAPTHGWVRTRTFREYRSRATFLGWPLVHYASGFDPDTGSGKTAKGWLAIGSGGAIGGIAFAGGWALGGIAVAGGGAVGLVGVGGGMALGALTLAGGWAVGVAAAVAGGSAVSGGLAVAGGYAFAPFAMGSAAEGGYVISAERESPEFYEQLRQWPGRMVELLRSLF